MFSGYNIYYETRKNIEEERNQRRTQIIEEIRVRPGPNGNNIIVPPRLDDREKSLENLRTAIFLNNISILTLLLSLTWFSLYYLLLPVSKAQEERNRFLAEASHELRTPLAILYSDLSLASSNKFITKV
jgi:signal transduction histidine kinase